MKYQFTIHNRLPSLNDYLNKCKHNRHIAAKFKMIIDRQIYCEIKNQLQDLKIEKPVIIHVTWIEENKRRDVDNVYSAIKYIQDALVKAEVLKNDNKKHVIDVKNEIYYAEQSCVIVELEEIEQNT